jgi:Protein of unknown function (DUF1579)
MNANYRTFVALSALVGFSVLAGAIAHAEPAKESKPPKPATAKAAAEKPAANAEVKLPPGWTEADLKAFMAAATPGDMHKRLVADAGTWQGKNTMWMAPGADPIETESATTITPVLDGRFVRCEIKGEMPGMGPYHGLAVHGYDNISKKFVASWIDNHSTSIAQGEGELSKDGKTLTWTFTCNCPLTKKPITMRQIETVTGPGAKTIEMFGAEPKTGEEYKMMRIELTKVK